MATPVKKVSHFRAHKRVQEHGELIDVHTGDVVVPPSMTKQEFVRECDVNNVIKQYKQTGMVAHVNAKASQGAYQDLPDAVDFQESLHLVMPAEQAFMTLPAKVRDKFGQDPAEFLAFMANPENEAEIRALGLANPLKEAPPPMRVEVVTPEGDKPDDQKA